MGQRANLVIVESQRFDLYYSHWCANTLPCDMFWGPAHAEAFVRLHAPSRRRWMVECYMGRRWCSNRQTESHLPAVWRRESFAQCSASPPIPKSCLVRFWQDWKILWAHEGIVDIAEYVGLPRQKVISAGESDDRTAASLEPPQERDWISSVGSFQIDDTLKLYPLPGEAEYYLRCGPSLCEDCHRRESYSTLALAEWTSSFPSGGFHVDCSKRTVDFWVSNDCPGLFDDVRSRWSGWVVTWHKDDYESQRGLTRGSLKFNEPSQQELAQDLSRMLMAEPKAVDILEITGVLAGVEGSKVAVVNPYALRDDRLPLGDQERRTILANAFAQIDAVGERQLREPPVTH